MSQTIIVTGMHRSGTSLISSLLHRAGIHIGETLIAANSANPRGYFEDVAFYEFHEYLLHQRGQTYLHIDRDFAFVPTADDAERARQLIAERSGRPLWGWKDPRTALFLSFWQQLLPEGRFLFVYRHPLEVLLSLLRRGEFDSHPSPIAGLHTWYTYNSSIKHFYDRHRDRSLLVHIDGVVKQPAKFAHLLREKLELDSVPDTAIFERIYQTNELRKTHFSSELNLVLARLYPQLLALYDQLDCQADLGSADVPTDSANSPALAALTQFIEGNLHEPVSLPVQHSILQLMLSLVAPDLTERMLVRFNQSATEMQQKIDTLWLNVQQFQRLHAEQAKELDSRAAHIESLWAELNSIHHMPIWKIIRSYRKFKGRWKKAA
jgi:Sulfotransferase family